MSKVFVLDTNKHSLAPVHPGGARKLLSSGKAAVFRQYPFTIILKKVVEAPTTPPLRLKIDPGSKTTGMAIVNDATGEVVWAKEFLAKKPEVLKRILAQAKTPLKDAAGVNATRWELYRHLQTLGLPLESGTGGRTKFNRVTRELPKTHWLDAVCVGTSTPESLIIKNVVPLQIRATGHGSRQMCRMDKYGFPRTGSKQHKRVQGFQTGDLVRSVVTSGTKQGTYVGKVAVRTRGTFNITTAHGVVTDIHHRFCVLVARSDGYTYQQGKEAAFPPSA
ncbi:MAG: RRXRR domain-containing protein [Acidobacteriia bacterium]|nr:RRXRR domain-containing protein [Terriglobia bacterium]